MSFLRQRLLPPVLLLLLLLSLLLYPTTSTELDQLLKLKASLEPSNPTLFTSWNQQTSTCNFTGIVCNSNGLVSEINLSQQNLHGSLPFDAICALPQLQKLSFGSNFLHGSLTDDLKSCTGLHELDLGNNSFTGEVPELSSLSQLRVLSLNSSGVSGLFPWKSLENLTELRFLSLGDNRLDESPITMELSKLEKLYWLYVSNCSITGEIPEGIGNLTLLENVELADNHMVGEIPRSITNLNKLWQLELYGNSLTGKIPVGFGNLTSLRNFDASTNKLEGDLSELKSLTGLVSLHLYENQLVGSVPEEFGEFKSINELSVYKNKLTGSLPQKLGSWSGMDYIDVSENYLTGPIPPGMCKNERMIDFLLLQNNFTGGIPESYVNCTSLVRLRVNNNSLSGTVPAGIWSLPSVTIIDLSMNQFEGPLAPDVGKANSLSLLLLANNRFSGELPAALSEATSLVTIQLSVNQFEGQIPETIGNLKKLGSLHLEQNILSGAIPDSLGSCVGISEINLAHNSLSGQIPPSLGSLPNLNSLNLSGNQLSSEVPGTLSSLKLSLLDLTNNHLIGRVPESLSITAFNESFDGNPGLCSQTMKNLRPCSSKSGSPSHPRIFLSSFIAGVLVLLILLGVFLLWKLRRSSLDDQPLKSNSWTMKQYHLLSFTEIEILDSIKAENLIGRGGSGNVYKVQLRDGKALAVKHIWTSPDSASQKSYRSTTSILKKSKSSSPEYDAEVATLSSLRHVNVVKLYCSISSEDSNLLVYEYFPNGSLWDQLHLNKKVKMGWEVRYEIALGAAKGLEYLHHGSHRPVIHRDVKSSNILLDGEWKPRIADFGLAKIVQAGGEMTRVIAGTYGYIAPEYAYTYKVNEKSDVYSFGVVLMELVTGKRPVEPEFGKNKDIVSWVYSKMQGKDTELELVDSSIEEALQEDALNVLSIAIRCTARVPVLRPSMRMVVQMLEEAQPCELNSISITKEGEDNPKMEQNLHY